MFGLFECQHPFSKLCVEKEHTEKHGDVNYVKITYHLHCIHCGEDLNLSHLKLVGGVKAFLARGKDEH